MLLDLQKLVLVRVVQLPVGEGRDVDILGNTPKMLNELLTILPCAFSYLAGSISVGGA